jgi:hypothetical protein
VEGAAMGFKALLCGSKSGLLIAPDLELHKHFQLLRKLGKGSYATV